MKRLILLALVMGCLPPPMPPIAKKVAAKQSALESRFDMTAFMLSDNGNAVKPTTVYYIVAEDRTSCEVSIGVFATTAPGDSLRCGWHE